MNETLNNTTLYTKKVYNYILELGYHITFQNKDEGIFVIKDEEAGINDLRPLHGRFEK